MLPSTTVARQQRGPWRWVAGRGAVATLHRMDWLPGSGVFRDHTLAFWVNLIVGSVLGYVVGRIRASGTQFEDNRVVALLSTTAGAVLGVTIFAFFGLFVLLMNFRRGSTGAVQVMTLSLLAQAVVSVVFVWRRR